MPTPMEQYKNNLMGQYTSLRDSPPWYLGALKSPQNFGGSGGALGGSPTPDPTGGAGGLLGLPIPGPTSVNPGLSGGIVTGAGGLTSAFDRPPGFTPEQRGDGSPGFNRPTDGLVNPRALDPGPSAFDRPPTFSVDYRGQAPPPANDPSVTAGTPMGIFGVYQDDWSKRALMNLLHQGFNPQDALNQISYYYQQRGKGPLGGPAGQASGSTGLGPGNQGPNAGDPY